MKRTEVRIGNFISVEDEPGRIQTIVSLSNKGFMVGASTLSTTKTFAGEKCMPIPLTADWLEEFEFSNNQSLWNFGSFTIGEDNGFYFVCNGTNIHLDYVHQLQNLYYTLNNEELSYFRK